MHLSYALSPAFFFLDSKSEKRRFAFTKRVEHKPSKEAVAGINAYIAIRDMCLAEAEASTTDATLGRVCMANEVVAMCLESARRPYEPQRLEEANSVHERERCEATKIRIAELACIATARYERVHLGKDLAVVPLPTINRGPRS